MQSIKSPGRRHLLMSSALGAAAALAPGSVLPLGWNLAGARRDQDDWSQSFSARIRSDPLLLGWQGTRVDQLVGEARIEGCLPAELRGTLYRNGPAVHERFGFRYRHWFDGDGMVQAFRFDGTHISHRGRVLQTPKFVQEAAANRRLYPAFGTSVARPAPVRRPDDLNAANISMLDHHGELLALWEGGSASQLNRETLAWQGFKSWSEGLRGAPFTAHPKVEPDGTLWAFGMSYLPRMGVVLYHIAPDGRLVKATVIDVDRIGMVHDFVVTERHLVIVIPPFIFEPEAIRDNAFLDAFDWQPALGSRVLVVAKDDFSERQWFQLPAGFGFHHGNGWEDAQGVIRFDHCVATDPTVLTERTRFIMRGEFRSAAPEHYTSFTLYPDGRADIETTTGWTEFPRVAPSVVGRRNRYVYALGTSERAAGRWLRRVEKRDLKRGTLDAFDVGPGVIPEEHVFVPRHNPSNEDDGWLVGTFLDYERQESGVSVFDARRIADGPIAWGRFEYPLPLGFHGHFSPAPANPL